MISEGIAAAPPIFNWQKCLGGSSQDMPVMILQVAMGRMIYGSLKLIPQALYSGRRPMVEAIQILEPGLSS